MVLLYHLCMANTCFWCFNMYSTCCDGILAARTLRSITWIFSLKWKRYALLPRAYQVSEPQKKCYNLLRRNTLLLKFKAQNKTIRNKKACEKYSLLAVSLKGGYFPPVSFSMSSNFQWFYCQTRLRCALSRLPGKIISFCCPWGVGCCQPKLQFPCY